MQTIIMGKIAICDATSITSWFKYTDIIWVSNPGAFIVMCWCLCGRRFFFIFESCIKVEFYRIIVTLFYVPFLKMSKYITTIALQIYSFKFQKLRKLWKLEPGGVGVVVLRQSLISRFLSGQNQVTSREPR